MSKTDLAELVEFAVQVAEGAGRIILPFFRTHFEVTNKGDSNRFDPVTSADLAAEKYIRARIREQYPDHGILGEEAGHEGAGKPFTWVVDPIDGTRAFMLGQLHWGTLLALTEQGVPRIGIMHQPYVGETYVGSSLGAQLRTKAQTRTLSTRKDSRLSQVYVCATDPTMFTMADDHAAFARVARLSRGVRYGGDCYTPCLVAAGHADLVIEAQNKLWDMQPLVPIIEAAGGIITDWSGGPVGDSGQMIVAANPQLHSEVLKAICEPK